MRELSGHMERAVYAICKWKEGSLDNIKTPKQLLPTGVPSRWDPDQLLHPLFCSATPAAMGNGMVKCRFVSGDCGVMDGDCEERLHCCSAQCTRLTYAVLEICTERASLVNGFMELKMKG